MCVCVLWGPQRKHGLFPYSDINDWFLGVSAKLRKATINFGMSVYPSVRQSAGNKSVPTGLIFMNFDVLITVQNLQISLQSDNNKEYFT